LSKATQRNSLQEIWCFAAVFESFSGGLEPPQFHIATVAGTLRILASTKVIATVL
jgi:hypothetical protein